MRAFVRLSIEWKLPLLMGGVLAVVILALSVAAYLEARRSTVAMAEARLVRVSRQLAQSLEEGVARARQQATAMANDSAVHAYLGAPGVETHVALREALSVRGLTSDLVAAVELVDRNGRALLATGPAAERFAALVRGRATLAATLRSDSVAVSPLVEVGDSAAYAVVAPVPRGGRHAIVVWRYLVSPAATRTQMADLIGSQATLYLGSDETETWTDFARLTAPPPVSLRELATPLYYLRGDSVRVGLGTPVGGAPWTALLEFSQTAVLGPLRSFVARLSVIAALVLAVGLWAAWVASRGITRPIRELTYAADAMRADDYSRRVRADRSDELGRLATAFNQAAQRVQEAQSQLEEKVADRTRALEHAQEALVRREKLAVLGLLAGGLSHELRNPLGVMTNAVYYLDGVLANPPAHVKRYLKILREQIERSEKILGDLIDFVGVEPPQREPVSPATLVDRQLERLAVPAHIRVHREFPATAPLAYVDPEQVGQVILNLLTNAVQAMGEQPGDLRIRAATDDGNHVCVEINDTGPGIPAERLAHIFEPLFTTKAQGFGLGLAVCRTLAAANGAEISVTSQEGRGATFTLVLPAYQEAVAA
jgi:signal transduction histidine kinase